MRHNKAQLYKNIIKIVKTGIKKIIGDGKFEVMCATVIQII